MSQSQLLSSVITLLNATGTPYMLTGSHASSLQGMPRSTHDIDFVVAMEWKAIPQLVAAFPPPDFYLDEGTARKAIATKAQFNLLDVEGGDKVDFWLLTDDAFDLSRFARRRVEIINGHECYVSSPEDTIIMKLRWAELCGGSEKQMGDARAVFEIQFPVLDIQYLHRWTQSLGVTHLWERLQREAVVEDE